MKINIKDNSKQLALTTAELIKQQLKSKPDSLLCFAAGHTQKETFEVLVDWHKKGELEFDRCRIISLDEWVGLPADLPGTCFHFIGSNILTPMNISKERYFFFDGCADDLEAECTAANEYIDKYGQIDLMLLGVGMNAHLGFNEPGANETLRSHVCELDNTTKNVGTKYFENAVPITAGITLGLHDILAADTVIVQATGEHKADIIKQICENEITNDIPASLIRNHKNAALLIDKAAAKKLI